MSTVSANPIETIAHLLRRPSVILDLKKDLTLFIDKNDLSAEQLDVG